MASLQIYYSSDHRFLLSFNQDWSTLTSPNAGDYFSLWAIWCIWVISFLCDSAFPSFHLGSFHFSQRRFKSRLRPLSQSKSPGPGKRHKFQSVSSADSSCWCASFLYVCHLSVQEVCYPCTHLLIEKLQSAQLTEQTTLGSYNCLGDSASARKKKPVSLCHHLHNVMNRLIK